jgi:hypothetical protein
MEPLGAVTKIRACHAAVPANGREAEPVETYLRSPEASVMMDVQ